jgi:hypothetical protein
MKKSSKGGGWVHTDSNLDSKMGILDYFDADREQVVEKGVRWE